MKRKFTFIMFLVCSIVSAQNITDVLRYSSENPQGTARFQSMGGAFGALGGDLSALNINPAGSVIFNNNLGTVSGSIFNRDNTSSYNGNTANSSTSYGDINQAGGVLVFESIDQGSNWSKIALALNYDVIENFDDNVFASGTTTEGIDNYFLNFANGIPLGDLKTPQGVFAENYYLDLGRRNNGFALQQAYLGFQSFLIDSSIPNDDTNDSYRSDATYTSVNQKFLKKTSGYNSKFTLNFSSKYKDKLSIGASLNFHTILYDEYRELSETNYDENSAIKFTNFDTRLLTEGSGFSLSVGAISKVSDMVRLGASYQSPTWFRLEDTFSQRINTNIAEDNVAAGNSNINLINFEIANFFPTYKLRVPAKITGSLALIFGKNGLLSFDYGYQDMSKAELGPTSDANFVAVNTEVANELGAINSFRLGGEYRIERFSLRGGYRFEESPYKNSNAVGDLQVISGGIGYNFGSSRLDLALNRTERDIAQRLFDTGINTPALVNGVSMNGTLSYTVNF